MDSVWHELAAGSVGGMAGILVGHPADTIKVRQQTLGGSATATLRATLRHEGARGLFKGMAFPLLTNGLLNAIYFGAYSSALRGLNWALGDPTGGGGDTPPDWPTRGQPPLLRFASPQPERDPPPQREAADTGEMFSLGAPDVTSRLSSGGTVRLSRGRFLRGILTAPRRGHAGRPS